MRELKIDEIREIQIMLLDEVVKFCEQKKLRYFLGYGTLLGAIRHRGYIPWDDDIDLIMPRPDYEKLISSYSSLSSQFKIYSQTTDCDYYLPFAKFSHENTVFREMTDVVYNKIGVNIDIFPIDGLSSDESNRTKSVKKQKIWRNILNLKFISISKNRSLLKNIVLVIGKAAFWNVDYRKVVKKMNEYASIHPFDSSQLVGCTVWNYGEREIMERRIFSDSISVEFEGKNYLAPADYKKYLENLYGDYMKLPPIEKRNTHHVYKAFLK